MKHKINIVFEQLGLQKLIISANMSQFYMVGMLNISIIGVEIETKLMCGNITNLLKMTCIRL